MNQNKLKKNDINILYKNILFREGDESGFNSYIESGWSLDKISENLKSSNEYKEQVKPILDKLNSEESKKILLFGAFGNGNLGDAIQHTFVKKGLIEAGFKGSVWACSYLGDYYNYDNQYKVPSRFIKSKEFLKNFDMIIVGGGGLLSHPHYPLHIEDWGIQLETPIALLAVGATDFAAPNSIHLIKKAIHVSGRDAVSVSCLRKYRSSVDLVPDPVLCMQDYETVNSNMNDKVAWVLKGPMNDELREIRNYVKVDDVVICFEKRVDQEIEELFPELIYAPTAESFYKAIKDCDKAFSMRYHGIILSLVSINNIYAMGDQKNLSLMDDMNIKENFIQTIEQLKKMNSLKRAELSKDHNKNVFVGCLKKILKTINA